MKKFLFTIAFVATTFVSYNAVADDVDEDPLLNACATYVLNGAYPAGITQHICNANFDLPSPFTIKCLYQIVHGWESEIDARACELHFENVKDIEYKHFNMKQFIANLLGWRSA